MKSRECPFCGGTKLKVDSKKGGSFKHVDGILHEIHTVTVRCNKCHAKGPTVSIYLRRGQYNAAEIMHDKAVDAWNHRVGDDLMERMVDDGK